MGHEESARPHGEDAERSRRSDSRERPHDDSVEPFFAGLSGAHAAGDEALRGIPADDVPSEHRGEPGDDDGPPPDPWRRAGRAHAHAAGRAPGHTHGRVEAGATDEDPGFDENRAGAGLVIQALFLMAALVLVSAAIYFVFGA